MTKKYVLTDYWNLKRNHRPYQNWLHDPGTDEALSDTDALADAIKEAGAEAGDELEIIVQKTGRRPFGDRAFRRVRPHEYEREKSP